MPAPEHLVRPVLSEEAAIYSAAFHELSTDRQLGQMAVGPIPFTAVDRYAERFGFSEPDDFRVLLTMVRVQDSEFLSIINRPKTEGDAS